MPENLAVIDPQSFGWAEQLSPKLLKSPWWIGHIPFAFELVGRLRPATIVELGTYSGSSFAAFCQAVEACGCDTKCYGIDLWEGDIHMGQFEEELFREISGYVAMHYPDFATLIRKDFNEAATTFDDNSIDLLHIDGTHTYEAVSNDFNTWLPKLSDRAVVLFHDTNVNVENTGPASQRFGVQEFFDSVKTQYPHLEFSHCWGLGVLAVGKNAPASVMELVEMAKTPGFSDYFAAKGALVSKQFDDLHIELPKHGAYGGTVEIEPLAAVPIVLNVPPPPPVWRRAVNKLNRIVGRLR